MCAHCVDATGCKHMQYAFQPDTGWWYGCALLAGGACYNAETIVCKQAFVRPMYFVPLSLCGAACRAAGAGPLPEPAGTPRPHNSKLPNKLSSTQSQAAVLASFGSAVTLHTPHSDTSNCCSAVAVSAGNHLHLRETSMHMMRCNPHCLLAGCHPCCSGCLGLATAHTFGMFCIRTAQILHS